MTTKQEAALRLALEALEEIAALHMSLTKKGCMALDAICEALAQPAAEQKSSGCCGHASDCAVHNAPALPVGPCDCGLDPQPAFWTRKQMGLDREFCEKPFTTDWTPLYTTQPAQPAADDKSGCDFCNHPLYTGRKCKNCGRVDEAFDDKEPK